MTDDGRLFAFGSLALVAVAGLARKGSRAKNVYWLREKEEDRYRIEIVIRRWRGSYRQWEVDSENRWLLATAPDQGEAESVMDEAIRLGEIVRNENPEWRDALPAADDLLLPYEKRSEVWIWAVQCWPREKSEPIVHDRSCLGGFVKQDVARRLHREVYNRWKGQRISFRTFAPGEAS